MKTSDFDYPLRDDQIAQRPLSQRDDARLLVDAGPGSAPRHLHVRDVPSLVGPGDVVVVNDTRVLPARVPIARRGGGSGEVLLLEPVAEPSGGLQRWTALVRPSRRIAVGTTVAPSRGDEVSFIVGEPGEDGTREVDVAVAAGGDDPEGFAAALLAGLERVGEMPLPPYLHEGVDDPERYQTVFARRPASAAAPTAGLHLTSEVMDGIGRAGATIHSVELVVGLATFRPMHTESVDDHPMHTEWYSVPPATAAALDSARRVIAIGTTTTRALEAAAATGNTTGRTDLFIKPPFPWRAVDVLMTNFHLPKSSLLVLVEALIGPRWRDLYAEAAQEGYRFLSFGDAMWLPRTEMR